jgi:predicted flavoprotein YhiN
MIAQIPAERFWSELKKEEAQALAACLTDLELKMVGRAIYKDEFVTAGGVELKEIHFQSLQSKILPGLYFAGEVLNIDGITGGFNFQNAWSSSWVAGTAIAEALGESISAKTAHF